MKATRKCINIIVLCLILGPSAQFAWRNRDMPGFGYLHDDGILMTTAKSIATGNSFRIPSLPENPYQTKFPPVYPTFLSIVWLINPNFPINLQLATFLSWVVFACCIALAWRFYTALKLRESRTWLMVGMLGICPYMVLFGCSLFTEILFTTFVLAALLLARHSSSRAMVLAGTFAGISYLTRTAGIALLISIPISLLLKRDRRRAILFAVTMLPFVIGWTAWVQFHRVHSDDFTLAYYTDYLGFQFINVGLDNILVVLWKNADQILYAMGSLFIPQIFSSLFVKIVTQVIGVAMIIGVVRLVRRDVARDYATFAVISTLILLVWHYPPTERFVLPLAPLLIAGLVTEAEHLFRMFREVFHRDEPSQKAAAVVFGFPVAILILAGLGLQLYLTFDYLVETNQQRRLALADRQAAYQWIAKNLDASATVFSYDDPLLYLYSGHHGNYLPMMTRWWYSEDHQKIVGSYRDIADYCRRRGFKFAYFTSEDMSREAGEADARAIQEIIRSNPDLVPVFHAGIGILYQIRSKDR